MRGINTVGKQSERGVMMAGQKKVQFGYQVTVTNGQSTTPKFTFGAGAPAAKISWGDGSALESVTSGTELTHTYTTGGTYTIKLIAPEQRKYLTEVDINTDKVSRVFTPIQKFTNLSKFSLQVNSLWVQNISGWQLPTKLTYFQIQNCTLTGDIGHFVLPSTLVAIQVAYNAAMTGNVNSWVIPAPCQYFWVHGTLISGCPVMTSMVAINQMRADSCSLSQTDVDAYLSRCVAREASTTYATPTLNLSGTNAGPSTTGLTNKTTLSSASWTVTVSDPQLQFQVTVTDGQSITPTFTMSTGSPSATVTWGDGTSDTSVTSGVQMSHTYTTGGTFTVKLNLVTQSAYLYTIDITSCHVSGSMWATYIPYLGHLGIFNAMTNSAMSGGFLVSKMPSSMITFTLWATATVMTGALSELPSTLVTLNLMATQSVLTGNISDIPASVQNIYLDQTSSVVSGGSSQIKATGIRNIGLRSLHLTRAQVDSILLRLATDEAVTTYATPSVDVGWFNNAPSSAGVTSRLALTTAGWTININPLVEVDTGSKLALRQNYVNQQFGTFMCWNMSSFTQDEWTTPNIDPNTFAPTGLDVDQWLDASVAAGATYSIFTTKHHDGFHMWPTAEHVPTYDPFGITATDWYDNNGSPDVVDLFVDSCTSHNLAPVLYFSIWDRTYEARSGTTAASDPAAYTAMVVAEVTELLTNYGNISALWFDGWGIVGFGNVNIMTIYSLIKSLQPNCLMLVNTYRPCEFSEIETYDLETISAGNVRLAEYPAVIRSDGGWFYHSTKDQTSATLRSAANLIADIQFINANNGTYALGCTPSTAGVLPAAQVTRLAELHP